MEDWIGIIRERLENEVPPPIEDDWDYFESNYLRMKPWKKTVIWSLITGAAAAIAVLLLFLPTSTEIPSADISEVNIPESDQIIENALPLLREAPPEAIILNENPDPIIAKNDSIVKEERVEIIRQETETAVAAYQTTEVFEDNSTNKTERKITISPNIKTAGNSSLEGRWSPVGIGAPGLYSGKATHNMPISFGINLSIQLNKNLSVTSGVDITRFHSVFTDEDFSALQDAYYIGIPLRLDWKVVQLGRTSIWVGIGGKADRLIYANLGDDRLRDNSINWSIIGNAGIQYNLTKRIGLFMAPEVSYYFMPENPAIQTYRTENPLMFTLGTGLMFSF